MSPKPPQNGASPQTTRRVLDDMFEENQNTVPLEDFVHTALHDEEIGYYASAIATVGRSGDFSTFATANSDLARGMAEAIRRSGLRDIIEVGAGSGQLAREVIKALGLSSRITKRLRYHIVDTSAPLVEHQKKALRSVFPTKVQWHDSVAAALERIGRPAFIFGNELIDAFAPVVLMWRETQQAWAEVCLLRNDVNGIAEIARSIPDLDDLLGVPASQFSATQPSAWPGGKPPYRQRIELHATFRDWWEEWAADLPQGSEVCWIDYGDTFPELYHREPAGTLRAYYRHERLTGPAVFTRMGKQDITSDVNFSDIRMWGESFGLTTTHDCRQSEWLAAQGIQLTTNDGSPAEEAHDAFRVVAFRK